jgi:replicative DNA helicase
MKEIPNDDKAERGVLGSILLDPQRTIPKLFLKPDEFYNVRHKLLYENLKQMYIHNNVMDAVTILNYLTDKNLIERVGGIKYLLELQEETIIPNHSESYQDIVREKYNLRSEIKIFENGLQLAYEGESASDQVLSSLINESVNKDNSQNLHELGNTWIENVAKGNTGHLNWFCPEWDDHLTKLSSEVCIIHAPRSTGKTAWLLQYICYLHEQGLRCSFASIEMIKQELLPRLIAHLGQINTYTMRTRGFITNDERLKSREANEKIKDLNLKVRDGSMNIMEIRSWALSEKKNGSQAIFIDNLLCINDGGKNYINRTAMYDYFIQQIIDLRNDIKIPIFLLAHPSAEGLVAYSRNIENLCDVILYLHTVPSEGIDVDGRTIMPRYDIGGDHVIAKFQKNRQGLSPVASLEFNKQTQTFKHLSWED